MPGIWWCQIRTSHCNALQHTAAHCNTRSGVFWCHIWTSLCNRSCHTSESVQSHIEISKDWTVYMNKQVHSYASPYLFVCVTLLICMCDFTYLYVWLYLFVCVTLLICRCDLTYLYVWLYLFVCGTLFICMCDYLHVRLEISKGTHMKELFQCVISHRWMSQVIGYEWVRWQLYE